MPQSYFKFDSEVYFDEFDALWVLHHARYLHHLERAQQAFFQHLLGVKGFDEKRDEDIYVVVKHMELNYLLPIRRPGQIIIRYTIERIREAGVIMGFEILTADEQTVYCKGSRTVCKLSAKTHQPTGWTAPFREAMEAWSR